MGPKEEEEWKGWRKRWSCDKWNDWLKKVPSLSLSITSQFKSFSFTQPPTETTTSATPNSPYPLAVIVSLEELLSGLQKANQEA